ncbi:hypothetical protein BDA99DRAFT_577704 [Phascolomyces articulosus]|uniref:Uncharacterized protein n=1 Tax=Phascolomyces articulosus TaxID=60185 RepID=A0AAD5PK44_9FUNG|nr:hypothetical protein BDA99DRAFT_577704 [Phascolomyces articulosus]
MWEKIVKEKENMLASNRIGLSDKSKRLIERIFNSFKKGGSSHGDNNVKDENKNLEKILLEIAICEECLNLLMKGQVASEEMMVIQALDIVVVRQKKNFSRDSSNKSELTFYPRFAMILDIIFKDTEFIIDDGEKVSQVTKKIQKENAVRYGDATKVTTFGRRIDLFIASSRIELSSSEWETDKASPSAYIQQQVKNIRTNKAIVNSLRQLPVEPSRLKEVINVGMNWIGKFSANWDCKIQMVLQLLFTAAVVIFFSTTLGGDFVNWTSPLPPEAGPIYHSRCTHSHTLDKLLWWKKHHTGLMRIIRPAHAELERKQKLAKARGESNLKRMNSPDTFFTLVT